METNASQLGLASRPTHAAFVRAGLNWHAGFAPCGVMIQMYDARVSPQGLRPLVLEPNRNEHGYHHRASALRAAKTTQDILLRCYVR